MYQSFRGESREVAWRLTKSVTESANSDADSRVASSSGSIGEIAGKILLYRHDLTTWRERMTSRGVSEASAQRAILAD